MTEARKPGWRWWKKLALATATLLFTVIAVLIGFRKPWVTPLPGVRVKMTRPFVKESDLGPESAYKLLLRAVEPPVDAALDSAAPPVWGRDWTDALTKLELHRWPAKPPPPAPAEDEDGATSGIDGVGAMSGMSGFDVEPLMGGPALAPEAPWTLEQVQDIQRLRKLYEPNVAILDQALAAPDPQVPTADSFEFLLPYLTEVRGMARWLSVSAQCRAATGDRAGALRDLDRILDMADIVCRGGCLINHLIGVACDAIATGAAWQNVTREDLPAPLLRQMARSFLAHADSAEPFVEAIRGELLPMYDGIPKLYQNGSLRPWSGGVYVPGTAMGRALARGGFLLAAVAGSTPKATMGNLVACYQHLIVIAEKPYSAAVQAEYDLFMQKVSPRLAPVAPIHRSLALQTLLRTRDPLGQFWASIFLPALDRGHARAAHRDAILRGMALFLAIKAYEKEHGALPEELAQLVPDYLPRMPKDPFDGKPFRCLRSNVPDLPPEAWAVYSIGEDFADDGGKARSVGRARDNHGPNPDLVWPSQPYPKTPKPQDAQTPRRPNPKAAQPAGNVQRGRRRDREPHRGAHQGHRPGLGAPLTIHRSRFPGSMSSIAAQRPQDGTPGSPLMESLLVLW
jgi:hypothetical protein